MFLNFVSVFMLFIIPSLSPQTFDANSEVKCSKTITGTQVLYPVEKGKKKKKKRKRLLKKSKKIKKSDDIVPNLYTTFIVLGMLPIFVIFGLFLIAFNLTLLSCFYIGVSLIILGNAATIIAGIVAGANKNYSTQVLSFALWLLFSINIVGGIVLLLIYFSLFIGWLNLLLIAILLLAIGTFMLIWALAIRKQNKDLRNT
ncbi:MAG: hypothetical protein MK207_07885 [Saprospiraceae bacterium]|nr:hypothetical protein [Saprospiraceae bacterium]